VKTIKRPVRQVEDLPRIGVAEPLDAVSVNRMLVEIDGGLKACIVPALRASTILFD
jgi:hypothetical protein